MATKKMNKATKAAPAEKVFAAQIDRDDERWLYLIDRRGSVLRMERGVPRAKTEVLFEKAVSREKGWMYYIDDDGDVVRAPDKSRAG